MIGGVILKIISESCFWTKIFQYQSIQMFMTIWGCNIKQWAVLFKINDSTYQLRSSLYKTVANFENNTDIYINQVAQNLYIVNLKSGQLSFEETKTVIDLTNAHDKINNLDKIFICPILSSKEICLQPVLNKDYRFYKENNVPNSGLLIVEYLKHQHVIININKYTCKQDTNRFRAVIFNVFTREFKVEIIKTRHNLTHCFYCNIISRIPVSRQNNTLFFHPRYTQAILNF